MPKRVVDKITPQGKKLFAELKKLAELDVQVGFTADKKGYNQSHTAVDAADYDSGASVAEVACWNEFGTRTKDGGQAIPERPFMRQSFDNHRDTIKVMLSHQLEAVVTGKSDADKAMRAIGAMQVGLIQHEIRNGGFVENAESTRRQKGSSAPLINEGRMIQSVHYVVKARKG